MVFYYTSRGGYHIYMGRDKFENEKLIQWGWPEDVWFHVDDMSSAHVYLRLKEVRPRPRAGWNLAHLVYALWFVQGDTIDTIDPEALYDCCQLVKVLWRPRCFVRPQLTAIVWHGCSPSRPTPSRGAKRRASRL